MAGSAGSTRHGHPGGSPGGHPGGMPVISSDLDRNPVVIFWEVTRACALKCEHCRAKAWNSQQSVGQVCTAIGHDVNKVPQPGADEQTPVRE